MSFLHRLLMIGRNSSGFFSLFLVAFFSMGTAHAITIDFDDLDPADFVGIDELIPLTDQYASLGVVFDGGAYLLANSPKSSPNYVAGPGFSFYFLNALPTYVSLYVGSSTQHKVELAAYGANGNVDLKITDGMVHGMNWEESTPYRPNQFISFFMPEGISHIHLGGQSDAYIDDLSFSVSVPEPNIFIMLWLGLMMIYLNRKRLK